MPREQQQHPKPTRENRRAELVAMLKTPASPNNTILGYKYGNP